jgi:WD40 repeat protein
MRLWNVTAFLACVIGLFLLTPAQAQQTDRETVEVVLNQGHTETVTATAFSADGRLALSASMRDKYIKLWDVGSGRLIRSFEGGERGVFSRDGRRMLSGGGVNPLRLWDSATGELITSFDEYASYNSHTFVLSPDGQFALSAGKELHLWDAATGKLVRTFNSPSLSVTFSPDGRLALSGNRDGTLELWDIATGAPVQFLQADGAPIHSVAFSADGEWILAGNEDGPFRLWDASTGKPVRSFEGGGGNALFSKDGRQVFAADWNGVSVWNTDTGRLVHSVEIPVEYRWSVALSPDGHWLLSGPDQPSQFDGAVYLWNAQTGRLVRKFGAQRGNATAFEVSQDDAKRFQEVGLDFHPLLRAATKDQPAKTFEAPEGAATMLSPDGSRAISFLTDEKLILWDVETGDRMGILTGHTGSIYARAFLADGTRLLTGSRDHTVRLWDTTTGRTLQVFRGHSDAVYSVAFSPDGRRVLSGSADRVVRLWDVATGKLIREFKGQIDTAYYVALSPDERLVASYSRSGTGGGFRVWDAESGAELAYLALLGADGWLITTPEGFFDVSGSGAETLSLVRGLQVASLDQAYQALYRPDLVAEKLAGDRHERVRDAAEKLDLADVMGSGGPPLVQFAALPDRVESGELDVRATLIDMGGGIGRMEWRVNGVVVAMDQGTASDRALSLERRLVLEPGENTIELAAYNVQGLLASLPAVTRVTSTAQETKRRPRLFVLAVGVNNYWDGRLQLNYAVPDATAIAEGLKKASADLYEDVTITTMLDDQVTVERLDARFEEISASMRRDDVFVFFLAGHGRTENGIYYFLPYDYRHRNEQSLLSDGISIHRFQEWFSRLPARKSVLLFDSCESGSIAEPRFSTRATERFVAIDKLSRAIGRTTLAAATGDALEGYRGHGVFTYTVLEAIGAAGDEKEYVGVTDLAAYIDERIPMLSQEVFEERQQPQIKIEGGNFPLFRQTYVLTDDGDDPDLIVSGRPTHVVVTAVKVRKAPGSESVVTAQLPAGARILVMTEDQSGWLLVARDGRRLGYVETESVLRLQ